MQKSMTVSESSRTRNITMVAIVAALYAAITIVVAPIGFGPVQLRLSEGLNHLSAWNKRYVLALGSGVLIANLVSPLGWIDWVFGTLGTVIMTAITYLLTKKVKSAIVKIIISSAVVSTIGMAILAAEFTFAFSIGASGAFASGAKGGIFAQWLAYYISVVPGELVSLIVGGIIIFSLSKIVDLSK
ncbi:MULTISPECIES: QueT transporter family protein [Leuconostoc]|uniref:Transporter n=1 Tax=Leuconostoc pseudomesenteroides TaxID=33968 RepID=A0A1X0VBP1_LEUPS|nr:MULTISPECIES: QueT transporter family protein [Leuconostoc]KDA48739.1 Substrate-specific component QueT of predicted queuosine-regulated ECF transporter [Leuconostoc pseudomesenteroides 1159]KDA49123.1 Substrate-specific component QueT of predicted queuosine-regulated ECF transporter [Leuconostoc pseudomesenteroides PS12]CCJ66795.1 Substrate-specific component QueT (COG4708) of predicted queuosine-regulated ECF transporter [Leuconostoc pseudomesenteroides 4882]MCT4418900.1 QueT transporter f